MRFDPRLPRDGINISHEHPLKEAVVLIVGLGLVFLLLFGLLLKLVDIVVAVIPPTAEVRALAAWGLADLEIETDNDRAEQLQTLVDRLATHWPDAPYRFRVGVLPQSDPNAFALPGGLILVTKGLLDAVDSENALALVLGHELGHFRHRDHLRQLGRGMVLGLGMSIIAPSRSSRFNLGDVIASLTARGFGREDERRSDRFGLELVHAEYGHVSDAWSFFEGLGASKSKTTAAVVSYLSTHPADGNRLVLLSALAREQGWPTEGPITPLVWNDD